MIVYGILLQSESDISCYGVFNTKKKRDYVFKYLEENEQSNLSLFYEFQCELITASFDVIKQTIESMKKKTVE